MNVKRLTCCIIALILVFLQGCGSGIAYENGPIRQTCIVETADGNFEFAVSLPSDVYDLSQVSPDERLEVKAQLTYLGGAESAFIGYGEKLFHTPVLHGPNGDLTDGVAYLDVMYTAEFEKDEVITSVWDSFELQQLAKGEYTLEMELSFYLRYETKYAHTFQIPIKIR